MYHLLPSHIVKSNQIPSTVQESLDDLAFCYKPRAWGRLSVEAKAKSPPRLGIIPNGFHVRSVQNLWIYTQPQIYTRHILLFGLSLGTICCLKHHEAPATPEIEAFWEAKALPGHKRSVGYIEIPTCPETGEYILKNHRSLSMHFFVPLKQKGHTRSYLALPWPFTNQL